MPQTYLAAVVQAPVHDVYTNDTVRQVQEANARWVASEIGRIASVDDDLRLLVWPVLCLTGSRRHIRGVAMERVATSLEDSLWDPIREACQRHGVWFASTLQETLPRFPGVYFHTGFVLGPDGFTLRSPKAQAFSAPEVTSLRDFAEPYAAAFGADAILPVAQTPLGRLGILVESEAGVPEAARLVASRGAEVIVHPTLERWERPAPHEAFRRAGARANGVYWLSAASSREPDLDSGGWRWIGGRSMIVGPDGMVEASVGEKADGVAIALVDLGRIPAVRKEQAREATPAGVLYRDLYARMP